ncbi:MAG: hypothetical protein JRJ12_03135 [Deltaproteobacteria bacterium]|nr:hypothetical protein [Deltaproteobacteria bacterium]MBW2069740.1 hypothetical protein [Deltaproteobacteria bacterium]
MIATRRTKIFVLLTGTVLVGAAVLLSMALKADAVRVRPRPLVPGGVYIDLDRDFYEALKEESNTSSVKTYSNDLTQEYLRRIAVSSEYMVKTNLEIIKQQERIIRLLEQQSQQQ